MDHDTRPDPTNNTFTQVKGSMAAERIGPPASPFCAGVRIGQPRAAARPTAAQPMAARPMGG